MVYAKVYFKYYIEICGDGLNMGHHECDDGNNIDGDGCSSTCKIEQGYKCDLTVNPNKCFDYIPPSAILILKSLDRLIILFDEKVKSKINICLSVRINSLL